MTPSTTSGNQNTSVNCLPRGPNLAVLVKGDLLVVSGIRLQAILLKPPPSEWLIYLENRRGPEPYRLAKASYEEAGRTGPRSGHGYGQSHSTSATHQTKSAYTTVLSCCGREEGPLPPVIPASPHRHPRESGNPPHRRRGPPTATVLADYVRNAAMGVSTHSPPSRMGVSPDA